MSLRHITTQTRTVFPGLYGIIKYGGAMPKFPETSLFYLCQKNTALPRPSPTLVPPFPQLPCLPSWLPLTLPTPALTVPPAPRLDDPLAYVIIRKLVIFVHNSRSFDNIVYILYNMIIYFYSLNLQCGMSTLHTYTRDSTLLLCAVLCACKGLTGHPAAWPVHDFALTFILSAELC